MGFLVLGDSVMASPDNLTMHSPRSKSATLASSLNLLKAHGIGSFQLNPTIGTRLLDADIKTQNMETIASNKLFFLAFLSGPMSGPAFLAVYRPVCVRLKRHFTLATAVAADSCINRVLMELLKKAVVFEARPAGLGVTEHFRVIL